MRVPLTLSIAGHTIVLAWLILLAAENPSTVGAAGTSGIEVVLGQSLSEAQTVLAPEVASQPPAPSPLCDLAAGGDCRARACDRGNRAAPRASAGSSDLPAGSSRADADIRGHPKRAGATAAAQSRH